MNQLLSQVIVELEINELEPNHYYVEVLVDGDQEAPPLVIGPRKFLRPGKFPNLGVFESTEGKPIAFPKHPRVRYLEVKLQNENL